MSNIILPPSNSNSQLRIFSFNGQQFRAFTDGSGDIWFIGPDCARSLGYANPAEAIGDHVDREDRGYIALGNDSAIPPIAEHYIPGSTSVINESGLFSLILRSSTPEAKTFKRWVTHEVLPAIRKTGSYIGKPLSPAESLLVSVQRLVDHERQLAVHEDRIARLEAETAAITDGVDYFTVKGYCRYIHTISNSRRFSL